MSGKGKRRDVSAALKALFPESSLWQAEMPLPEGVVCACQLIDVEDPGPHTAACPWNDPDYSRGFP